MPNQPAFQNLNGHQYMALTTYRRSGAGVPTPVWFAQDGDRLYIITVDGSGKVKRIRNNAGVHVAPSDARGRVLGPEAAGAARVLPPAEATHADACLNRKYGFQKRVFDLMGVLGRRKRVVLEVAPASLQ